MEGHMSGEYNYLKFQDSICPCCNAGMHNDYKHDRNCLINVPGKMEDILPYWNQGWNAWLKLGKLLQRIPAGLTEIQMKAFSMGASAAERMGTRAKPRRVIRIVPAPRAA
jgi:hypothetical protein